MCAPAFIPVLVAGLAIAGGVYLSESQKAEKENQIYGPNPDVERQNARKQQELMNARAQKPIRANAADALYGNVQNQVRESGPMTGTPSTGITTSQSTAAPTALTLGKSDLLGQ